MFDHHHPRDDAETREEYQTRAMQWLVDATMWQMEQSRIVLSALTRMEHEVRTMTQAMGDFKVQLAAYYKKVDDYITRAETNQVNSDALVAAAVAKEQAGQTVDVQELSAALAAEADKVPAAPAQPAAPPGV